MRRIVILFLTAALGAALVLVAVPPAIGALPDRYVVRLPEPLQKYGLPEDTVALLPTVSAPAAAAALLETATAVPQETQFPVSTASPPAVASPTPSATATVAAEPTSTPTVAPPTATATASATATYTPTSTPTLRPRPSAARLEGISHKFQTWNNCGPATLAMALTYFGDNVTQEQTAAFLKPDPEDRNVTPDEMAAYVEQETPYRALFRANGDTEILRQLLANGIPVIVEIGIDPPGSFSWLGWYGHYLLLVAYDDDLEEYRVYDSWFGTSEEPLKNADPSGRVLSYEDLDRYWPQFNRNYISLYEEGQEALVQDLLGDAVNEDTVWNQALIRVRAETSANPEDAFSWFNLGTIYNALAQYDKAATAFDQARALGLPWRMLWYQFGPYEAYYQTGRYEDVLLLADTTLKDRPYFEESYYYKGLALAALGDQSEARRNLELAARFNPNFAAAVRALQELEQ